MRHGNSPTRVLEDCRRNDRRSTPGQPWTGPDVCCSERSYRTDEIRSSSRDVEEHYLSLVPRRMWNERPVDRRCSDLGQRQSPESGEPRWIVSARPECSPFIVSPSSRSGAPHPERFPRVRLMGKDILAGSFQGDLREVEPTQTRGKIPARGLPRLRRVWVHEGSYPEIRRVIWNPELFSLFEGLEQEGGELPLAWKSARTGV